MMATSAAPAEPGGVDAVIEVLLTIVRLVAGLPPNVTKVVPVRFVPVIDTLVTPVTGPDIGEMLMNVGMGGLNVTEIAWLEITFENV
jgi:hypothetical protein